jgi:hypothetical protein
MKSNDVFLSCELKIWCWACYITIWSICTIVLFVCACYTSSWINGWFYVVFKSYYFSSCIFVDSCALVWWSIVVYSYDYNSDVICSCYCDYKYNVI